MPAALVCFQGSQNVVPPCHITLGKRPYIAMNLYLLLPPLKLETIEAYGV
jgi:hypothetical protein